MKRFQVTLTVELTETELAFRNPHGDDVEYVQEMMRRGFMATGSNPFITTTVESVEELT